MGDYVYIEPIGSNYNKMQNNNCEYCFSLNHADLILYEVTISLEKIQRVKKSNERYSFAHTLCGG